MLRCYSSPMIARISLICCLLVAAQYSLFAQDEYPQGTAMLGVMLHPVPLHRLEQVGLAPGQGTMITRVWPNSAADRMGLQVGDVIVNVNGTDVDSRRDVRTTVISHNEGDDAQVTVLRNSNQPIELNDRFGALPPWLEERLKRYIPRMTTRWEDHVAARQRAILAAQEKQLEKLAEDVNALEKQHAADANPLQLLQPLDYSKRTYKEHSPSSEAAWTFTYSWTLKPSKKEKSCASSSLVHF